MRSRLSPVLLVLAVVVTACTNATDTTTATTTTTTSTTIVLSVRSTAESVVTIADAVDPSVAESLTADLEELRAATETLRGLGFIGPPPIALLDAESFAVRRNDFLDAILDPVALAAESRLYRMLGLLDPGQDVRALVRRTVDLPVRAYYDGGTGELVVDASTADLPAADRSVIVRELVRLLTDQYHDHSDRIATLETAGMADESLALAGMVTADAVYTQLRYVDGIDSDERAAAVDGLAPQSTSEPAFLTAQLAFAGDAALTFVGWQLERGGFPALDEAYLSQPTTEMVLHPVRFAAGEGALEIVEPAAELAGYQLVASGTFGELRLKGLLSGVLSPGLQTQVADGWGADRYLLFTAANDVVFAYTFRGDTVADTFEVAQAFLDHTATVMRLAEPLAVDGGAEFVGPALATPDDTSVTTTTATTTSSSTPPRPGLANYAYVDRVGDALVFIVSTSIEAGMSLRDQVGAGAP